MSSYNSNAFAANRGIRRIRNQYASTRYRRRYLRHNRFAHSMAYKSRMARIADQKINTVEEKRMLEIAKKEDDTTTWLLSRIDHFPTGLSYGGSHKSPAISQMIKLSNNVLYWQDVTQLPSGDPSDATPEMGVGLYNIKTIQSRLRFFVNGLMPVHLRVLLIKIPNSGRYQVGNQNTDIVPNSKMIPDTNLRYSGIHAVEGKYTTAPGDKNASIIAQANVVITPRTNTQVFNSASTTTYSRQVFAEKQIILTKTYKNYIKLYQVVQQETADTRLDTNQSSNKFIGDRVFLCIFANYQQGFDQDTQSNTADTSNIYFYGTSGCIYNFDKKPMQVSIPLGDNYKIDNTAYQPE